MSSLSTTASIDPVEIVSSSLSKAINPIIPNIPSTADSSIAQSNEASTVVTNLLPISTSAVALSTDSSCSSGPNFPTTAPPMNNIGESKTSSSNAQVAKDNAHEIVQHLNQPMLSSSEAITSQTPMTLPMSSWPASAPPVVTCHSTLSSTISASLTVLNAAGELSPVHVLLPNQPLVVLKIMPIHGTRIGEQVTLSIPTKLILENISKAFENGGGSFSGGPIIIPITLPPNVPISNSVVNTESVVKSISTPMPSMFSIGLKSSISTGVRKMRAIAPKPSSSIVGPIPVTSISNSFRSSGSRPPRKLFASPAVQPLIQSTSATSIPAGSVAVCNPVAFAGCKSHATSILHRPCASNSPSRNRIRKRNSGLSVAAPVAISAPNQTNITQSVGGYIIDPSGTIMNTDASAASGGFIQPVMQSGPNAPQFFAPPGSFFVSTSNGIIQMPISGVLPSDGKAPDLESTELIASSNNPFQSGFLIPADGNNDGFSHPVYFSNGAGPNSQFILPGYQSGVPSSGDYVQQFPTQPTEYLHANGELYLAGDGSSYVSYPGLLGSAQPMTTVDLKDDGDGVDASSDNDDIINIAMRVACGEQVICMPESATINSSTVSSSVADVTDNSTGIIGDFIQSSTISRFTSNTEMDEKSTVENLSPPDEKNVTPGDQTSTGDAKIDALLAEAALVSSVNGVGDNQSAVSVPATSLLTLHTVGPPTTTVINNEKSCAIAETIAPDVTEFTQSLYETFADFGESMMSEVACHSSSEATEAAITFISQKVEDLESVFGPDDHVTDSFLKSLVNQADHLDSENVSKLKCHEDTLDLVAETLEDKKVNDIIGKHCNPGESNEVETSHIEMVDLLQFSFSQHVDEAAVSDRDIGDDDDNFFPFPREYTSSEQFDEALQLLGSPPPSNSPPPCVPDDVDDENVCHDVPPVTPSSIHESDQPYCSDFTDIQVSGGNDFTVSHQKPFQPSDPTEDSDLHQLSLYSKNESVPNSTEQLLPLSLNPEDEVVDNDGEDDSGSELDFLPSRCERKEMIDNNSPEKADLSMASTPNSSPRDIAAKSSSPYLSRSPKHSTPRSDQPQRKSPSARTRSLERRRRSLEDTSFIPISSRKLRSAIISRKEDNPMDSECSPTEDTSPLLGVTPEYPSESGCAHPAWLDRRNTPLTESNANLSSKRSFESSQSTYCCVDDSTVACRVDMSSTPESKRRRNRLCSPCDALSFVSPLPKDSSATSEDSLSAMWSIESSRPTSFGFFKNVDLPLPNINISSNVELRDHPALIADEPFWGDPEETIPADDDDKFNEEKDYSTEACALDSQSEIAGVFADADSPPSPPTPELLATVTAVSIGLNISDTPSIFLPGNETAFSKFATSASLPSFSDRQPTTAFALQDVEKSSLVQEEDSEESDDITSPTAWLRDSDKLAFSQNLFPPKFSTPFTPNPLATRLNVPVSPKGQAASPVKDSTINLSSPSMSPVFGGSSNSLRCSNGFIASNNRTLGSFAGAAAFRASSFSSIAAKASSCIFSGSTSELPITTFSEIAKASKTHSFELHVQTSPFLSGNSSLSVCKFQPDSQRESEVCSAVGASTREHRKNGHHKRRCRRIDQKLSRVVHYVVEEDLVEPLLDEVANCEARSPCAPLIGKKVRCTDVAPTSALQITCHTICPLPHVGHLAPIEDILSDLEFSGKGFALATNSDNGKQTPQLHVPPGPIRLKIKLPPTKHRLKCSGKHNEEFSGNSETNKKRSRSPTILRLSRVGGTFCTKKVRSLESPHKHAESVITSSSTTTPTCPTTTAAAAAPPIWAAVKRRKRSTGRGLHNRPVIIPREMSSVTAVLNTARQSLAQPSGTATLSKKFFSSSKEDRRSSAIKSTRPWRPGFRSPSRKRAFALKKSDPVAPTTCPPTTQMPVRCATPAVLLPQSKVQRSATHVASPVAKNPLRVVIRLPKDGDNNSGRCQSSHDRPGDQKSTKEEEDKKISASECDSDEEVENVTELPVRFSIAPEAEAFVDSNQARVRILKNKAFVSTDELGEIREDAGGDEEDGASSFSSDGLPNTAKVECDPSPARVTQAPTPSPSTFPYHNQQPIATQSSGHFQEPSSAHEQRQKALAAACAAAAAAYVGNIEPAAMRAMWASSFFNNLSGSGSSASSISYTQQQISRQQSVPHYPTPNRGLYCNVEQQQQQQPVFPPYQGIMENSTSNAFRHVNEAHQQSQYAVQPHLDRVAPASEVFNHYPWHHHPHHSQHNQNSAQLSALDRATAYHSSSSVQQLQQALGNPQPSPSQWYSGGVTGTQPPSTQPPVSNSCYPQYDNSSAVNAVAQAGYLPSFPRLS